MYCPRLKHFVRLNQDGSIGKCGHMINAMGFKTFDKLDNSKWLKDIKDTMAKDEWPNECKRCQQTEELNGESIRTRLDIPVAEYDENESKFFKFALSQHRNKGVQHRESV